MSWQCQHVDAKGHRCLADALYRLHFSTDHAFDHMDVCDKHLEESINIACKWYQYFLPDGSLSLGLWNEEILDELPRSK